MSDERTRRAAALTLLLGDLGPGAVAWAWSRLQQPEQWLSRARWSSLFALDGYTDDGRLAGRPDESITLYRGAQYGRRLGMAWTATRAVAERFGAQDTWLAEESPGRRQLWTARVEPWRLYAHINELSGRREDEYVINTRRLAVTRCEPATAAA